MKNLKKLGIISLLSMSLITGCSTTNNGEGSSEGNDEVVKIGISQLMEHPSLDESREGFIKALEDNGYKEGENLEIDYQNAQGDMPTSQTIAKQFVSKDYDLIHAIATGSVQSAYNATKDIPIILSAVTNPEEAKVVESNEKPNTNVSGASDAISVEEKLEAIELLGLEVKTIGVIYNTSEINSTLQVEELKKYCSENGYKVEEVGITSTNEINSAISSLGQKIDMLYVATDNLVVSSMPIVAKKALEYKIPIISSDEGSVENGALASKGIKYYDLGYLAGEMAVDVLKGEEPSSMPIGHLSETTLLINEDTLNALGIDKPETEASYIGTK